MEESRLVVLGVKVVLLSRLGCGGIQWCLEEWCRGPVRSFSLEVRAGEEGEDDDQGRQERCRCCGLLGQSRGVILPNWGIRATRYSRKA